MTWQRFGPRRIQYGSNSDTDFQLSRRQHLLAVRLLPTPTPMPISNADADRFDFDSNDGLIKFSIGRVIR